MTKGFKAQPAAQCLKAQHVFGPDIAQIHIRSKAQNEFDLLTFKRCFPYDLVKVFTQSAHNGLHGILAYRATLIVDADPGSRFSGLYNNVDRSGFQVAPNLLTYFCRRWKKGRVLLTHLANDLEAGIERTFDTIRTKLG